MADAKTPDNNEEPLIPMPAVAPPAQADAQDMKDAPQIKSSPSAVTAASEEDIVEVPEVPGPAPVADEDSVSPEPNGNLEDIKQKALTELRPLLDEVDLPADQKFHTILEIISATNDKELIPKLYEAASAIEDKHEKAKALVDVVSEIEYLNKEA